MNAIELHIAHADRATDVIATIAADASVADVLQVLQLPADTTIDGRPVASPQVTAAAEVLYPGAELAVQAMELAADDPPGFVDVSIVAGLDAGAMARLGSGLFHLSASPSDPGWYLQVDHRALSDSPATPWHEHGAALEVIVPSTGGGQPAILAVGPPVDPEPASGHVVRRPPQSTRPPHQAAIHIGDAPDPVPDPAPLSWATLLTPIPIAVLMAVFFRPIFALFAAMGPVMALGRWWEGRRRHRKALAERRRRLVELRTDIERQRVELAEAHAAQRWCAHPPVGVLLRRAMTRSVRLWERRLDQAGSLTATTGVGPAQVAVETTARSWPDEISDLIDRPVAIRPVPHLVDLDSEPGFGVAGLRPAALAVARSIVLQLATMHGPADLRIGVLCQQDRAGAWDWIKWLPHTDRRLVAHAATEIVGAMPAPDTKPRRVTSDPVREGPVSLIIVDALGADVAALERAAHEARIGLRILAVAPDTTLLPAMCARHVTVDDHGLQYAGDDGSSSSEPVLPTGVSPQTAQTWARSLASLVDPEVRAGSSNGNAPVSLLDLIPETDPSQITSRWDARSLDASPVAKLGVGAATPFQLDLRSDGPHALVAGTTGSGKSELLRTLVVGLAVDCPPEALNFVLVDFKGGGAFDVVAGLPHVVGVITDLDEALIDRALISLRAELERRERLFRELGVSDFGQAVLVTPEPLARLVIVIDEFAALATDHGELLSGIVDLASRGRSLGMHLVLATQRPSGVVDQKIRANTNVRIALRVQDALDSQDVVGIPDAAMIDRMRPGHSVVRIGGDRPVHVQMAFTGRVDQRSQLCTVRPHRLFDDETSEADADQSDDATELHTLVRSVCEAATGRDARVRALWAPPLPANLDWIELELGELDTDDVVDKRVGVALGLVDLPGQQLQLPWRWDPRSGALCVYGASAPCAGKALLSIGAALASTRTPDRLHLYVIDGGAGLVSALVDLPHTGSCISATETDRVERVVARFEAEVAQRRASGTADTCLQVLLIDNLASVLAEHDDLRAAEFTDRIAALARDGASLGVVVAISARAPRDVSHRLAQQIPHRLVLELADDGGYLALGLRRRDVPALPPMRAIDARHGHVVQLVEPPDLTQFASAQHERAAPPINAFPNRVPESELPAVHIDDRGELCIPVGIRASDLAAAELTLRPGEHALIVGAPGMGRTAVADLLASRLSEVGDACQVIRLGPRRDHEQDGLAEDLAATGQRTVVIIDDAHELDEAAGHAVDQLIDAKNPQLHIIAVTSPEAARAVRGWTSRIRASGTGILLGATPADGDIFKVRLGPLPGRGSVPGRGDIVRRGQATGVQFALANAAT